MRYHIRLSCAVTGAMKKSSRKEMMKSFKKLKYGVNVLCQSKQACILWSHHEETRELPGERDNARNNARCTKARKTTHGLDGQHQDVDRTLRGRSIRMTEDRDKWRKYVDCVANPRIEDGYRTRTLCCATVQYCE